MNARSVKTFVWAAAMSAASLCSLAGTLPAAKFSAVYVFGDSLSDSGNNAIVIGSRPKQVITGNSYIPTFPYASGDYSNGQVWVNAFDAGLGLSASAAPSLAGGGDYAYGGALTVIDGNGGNLKFPPSATTQLGSYLANAGSAPPTALYVIAIGGNDAFDTSAKILAGAPEGSTIAADSAAYAAGVAAMVYSLKAAGAAHIMVWDTPDIGLTPSALAANATRPGTSTLDTHIASAFNTVLAQDLTGISGVTTFDVFGLLDTVVADPAAYMLTNVTDACGAIVGCNPAQYLFWDGIHPTSGGHALIAQAMPSAVPEPASIAMLAAGLLTIGLRRRRYGGARLGAS